MKRLAIFFATCLLCFFAQAERKSPLVQEYIAPVKVIWTSGEVQNAEAILIEGNGQADLNQGNYLRLVNRGGEPAAILLDFGRELQGGVEIITSISNTNPAGEVRLRFGESAGEAMAEIGQDGATNDHALRDFTIQLPWLGRMAVGETGFRFLRIDLLTADASLEIKEVNAIHSYRDIPYLGSFRCNDDLLNTIWQTGAYTVHLNMQEYLWDGIKRDRLVWVGDLHPEVMTVSSVFGHNEVVPRSLDLARDITALHAWMNGISSYSIWWLIIHRDWYLYHGDIEYLREQKDYMNELLLLLSEKISPEGKEMLDGNRFLDWPSSEDPATIHAGLQSMMVMAFQAGSELTDYLSDPKMKELCLTSLEKLSKYKLPVSKTKQGAALQALAGLVSPEKVNKQVLSKDGAHGMSSFYGYYMLTARAEAGDQAGAIQNIRDFWGGMIRLGATTFWEDFNIDWLERAAPIDALAPEDLVDVHASYGSYCYRGYRNSLCHGWASGPTAWLTRYVLGVQPVAPGFSKVRITPHLGDLTFAEGTIPTPHGLIHVKHSRRPNGEVSSEISLPEGVIQVD